MRTPFSKLKARVAGLDWTRLNEELLDQGYTVIAPMLSPPECRQIMGYYEDNRRGGAVVDLAERGFGQGGYRYLKPPFPKPVVTLRDTIYGCIVASANAWSKRTRYGFEYPPTYAAFQKHQRAGGHPEAVVLRYEVGGRNNLHQDLNDGLTFPYQVIFGLSTQGKDYDGGYLVLLQERRGGQSIPHVVTIPRGGAIILSTSYHAERGPRGYRRTVFKHGVSRVTRGVRCTLGIVFHNFVD